MGKKLLDLFLTFFKIGAFTFGGGYAMIPVIEEICVEKKLWITHEDMVNVTVIAESTPGPIAINCATFVGYKQGKFWGAVAATLGVVMPSFIIIYLISMFFNNLLEFPIVTNAFRGIKIGVGLLIVNAGINMGKKIPKKPLPMSILAVSVALMLAASFLSWNLSTIVMIVAAGVIGLALFALQQRGGKAS
ncbi:MAG: chromate transporter [Ruminococcaceae bacterium]|nr:chromate transporter [Oscillospiraceae bacterium]